MLREVRPLPVVTISPLSAKRSQKKQKMDTAQLFSICNMVALPFWLALILIPDNKWVKNGITAIALLLAVVYIFQIPTFFSIEEGGFGSLEEVMILFKNEKAVLAGWIHYLVFDLLIGRWIATDASSKGISKFLVAPCLLCTLMFGPVGFLLYTALKYFYPEKVE